MHSKHTLYLPRTRRGVEAEAHAQSSARCLRRGSADEPRQVAAGRRLTLPKRARAWETPRNFDLGGDLIVLPCSEGCSCSPQCPKRLTCSRPQPANPARPRHSLTGVVKRHGALPLWRPVPPPHCPVWCLAQGPGSAGAVCCCLAWHGDVHKHRPQSGDAVAMRVQVSLSVWLVALLSLGWAATPAQGGDREGWVAGLPGVGSSSSEPGRPPILRLLQEDSSNTTGFGFSVNGCKCLTACDTSFDSLIPWCTTSEIGVLREEVLNPCGQFSQRRSSYWDECVVNVTSVDHLAETFDREQSAQ